MNNPMSMPPDQWITFSVAPISRIAVELSFLLFDKFGFAQSSCEKIIARYFTAFRDDISVLIELPYVDKVFRNSYYHYFSSKHCRFERDSIRLSFFEGELSEQYLSDSARYSCLAASFLGVVIIRPTFPQSVSCDDNQVITRFYLTSSRSYKNWVVHSILLQKELKDVILATSMPKFIWITEISDAGLYGNSMAAGMVIIDATGDVSRNSLLFSAYSGTIYLRFDGIDTEVTTGFANFTCYENNLKGEWSQWKA